ncbi:hypothetical protein OS493_009419 [Desmophyllum pertusum]|uniref:Uncharacterized protein n=1 Tax=Desmophyllum pertusum TaxID=174260 RepID=A0A9W9Z2E0_9CNID|nr:hypothetical protein OS493_009419 [Desmophyllum pertusum]
MCFCYFVVPNTLQEQQIKHGFSRQIDCIKRPAELLPQNQPKRIKLEDVFSNSRESRGITTAQQMQPSHEASEYTCLPLADANRSAVLDVIRPDSPQTPPCKKTDNEILRVLNDGTIKELKKLQGVGQKRAQAHSRLENSSRAVLSE